MRIQLALLLFLAACGSTQVSSWPQGAGPNGDWTANGPAPPARFSVRTGENIRWRTPLPETGQGGIAVHADRVFVATMAPWDPVNALSEEDAQLYSHAIENRSVAGKGIVALCLDADSGDVLWSRSIDGEVPAIYTYPFSDATSASPVTDGEHVWFTNAAGSLVCFTVDGEPVWERRWTPAFDGPFNKQFEPFLVAGVLVTMEPFASPDAEDPESLEGRWHYLVGLDAATGAELWRSEDGLTQYNAPTLVDMPGGACVLHARGGPHAVPERPVGISMTRVTGPDAGKTLWRYDDPRGNHEASLQTMAYDDEHVYWILKDSRNALVVLDRATGEELREVSLVKGVTRRSYDAETADYVTAVGVDLEKGVFPARYSMIAANGHVYFQCYALAWGKPTIGPPYSFARVDPARGSVEYLEVPTGVVRAAGGDRFLWRTPRTACPLNSRGVEVTGDDRSRWDGWDWVFNGSPTRAGNQLYFTLASGLVYVIEAGTDALVPSALLSLSDLGAAGEVWSANSVSCAGGRLYHRTGAELICIEDE